MIDRVNTVKNEVNAPIKETPRGAKNYKNTQKIEQTPRGASLFFFKCPWYVSNAPGRSFSRFFERKAPWGESTTREGVRKGPAAGAERDASQHAVGGIARVSFFLLIFIHQFK